MLNTFRRRAVRGAAQAILATAAIIGPQTGVASGQAIIDNNTVKLGVDRFGQLNIPGTVPSSVQGTFPVGLRYLPFGLGGPEAEATAHGCLCEGWGISCATPAFTCMANNSFFSSPLGLVSNSFVSTASTAMSDVSTTGGELRIVHDFKPSPFTPNLYEVAVTVTNTGTVPLTGLTYRRNMDWDVEQTVYDEFSTIDTYPPGGTLPPSILSTTTDGFVSSDPTVPVNPIYVYCTGTFTDCGSPIAHDQGAQFDFDLGNLNVGASTTFTIFYGAAESEPAALNALGVVNAKFYSFGQPNLAPPADHGEPNTFIFAFGGELFDDCARIDSCFVKAEIIDGVKTGCYEVQFGLTNLSGKTAHYILFPGGQVTPSAYPLVPPLPPGGSTSFFNPVKVRICGPAPGSTFPLQMVLMDIVPPEKCCELTKEVELPPADDCFQFDAPPFQLCFSGSSSFTWFLDLVPMQYAIGHIFVVYEPAPGTSYAVTVTPDYFPVSVPQYGVASLTINVTTNAPPDTPLCFRIFTHTPDLVTCCSELVCTTTCGLGFGITDPPTDTSSCLGGSATFTVGVAATGPVEYKWYKDGVPLVEGGIYHDTKTATLHVSPVNLSAEGSYTCVIATASGSVVSPPARLKVCIADIDCDGVVDFSDYLAFLNLYDVGTPIADVNGDGVVDFVDYLLFLNHFTTGC